MINRHLKKGYPILINFGTNIFGTSSHQMTGQFSTLPNVCFCTTWGKLNQQNMRQSEQNCIENIHIIIDCHLKRKRQI